MAGAGHGASTQGRGAERRPYPIAIDGPVASGKTAVGRALARRLGYRFLDTGLMYRAVAWLALQRGVPLWDTEALERLAREPTWEVAFPDGAEGAIRVGGEDVTGRLRSAEVDDASSIVAQAPGVRATLVAQQRGIAEASPVVMAGRDIGTVVVPQAPVKLFLTALVSERARRRYAEMRAEGQDVLFATVLEEMERRDRRDAERSVSPLRPANDATVVSTDGLSVDGVVEELLRRVKEAR